MASTLGLLLLSAAASLLFFGVNVSSSSASRVALQQTALVTMERLLRDLQPTTRSGVAYQQGPPATLSIHPRARDPAIVAFGPELTLYSLEGGVLCRRQTACPVPGPRAYRPESPQDWASLLSAGGRETARTEGVTRFAVILDRSSLLHLELELASGTRALTTRRAVFLRQGAGP